MNLRFLMRLFILFKIKCGIFFNLNVFAQIHIPQYVTNYFFLPYCHLPIIWHFAAILTVEFEKTSLGVDWARPSWNR